MARLGSSSSYSQHCTSRLPYYVQRQASSVTRGQVYSFKRSLQAGSGRGSSEAFVKKGHRAGSLSRARSRFLFHLLPGAKKIRRIKTDPEFETLQSVCVSSEVQNGDTSEHHHVSQSGRVVSVNRSERCVPPCTNPSVSLPVATVCHRGRTLPMESIAFRPFHFASDLYKSTGSGSSTTPIEGYSCSSIPRRPFVSSPVSTITSVVHKGSIISPSEGRLYHKCPKVRSEPHSRSSFYRGSVSDRHGHGFPSGGSSSVSNSFGQVLYSRPSVSFLYVAKTSGSSGFHSSSGQGCETIYATSASLCAPVLVPSFKPSSKSGCSSQVSSTSTVVERPGQSNFRSVPLPSTICSCTNDRCIWRWLGGGTRSQVNLQRHVDNPTESLAYKLFRAEGSVSSLTAFCKYPKGYDYSGQDGQFHNGSLPQLQWGNEVAVSQSFNLGTSTVVHSTQDFHKSCSRSGDQQRVGGCLVEKQGSCVIPNNSQSHGMVAEFSSPRSGFSIEGHSGDRSVCLALQSEASQVVQLGSRTRSSGMECVLNSVERIPVCVSSNPLNTEGCSQVEERQSQTDSNSSILASEPVGFGVTPIISGSSHPTSTQTGLIVSTGSVPSATGDSQPGGLDSVWDSYRARGFSEAVIDTLRAARKSSTQGAYEAQWRVFCRWCRDGGHDPFSTSIEVLLEFFDYLFQQGRAYSTIKGYTSMLTAIRGQIDGYSFANHPLVATFLKGVLRKRPPVKSPVPAWDLDIVLNYLMSQEFEPSEQVSLDLWTLKTVFLLAICSACRCSELQALDRSEQFMIIRRRSLSLRTNLAFLPKVPKADYINREIFLEALPSQGPGRVSKKLQTLCPVRALRIYVDKSAPFRKPSVGQLFISYRRDNLGNPVTKQRIATWLVQLIKKAYVYFEMDPPLGVKAHSTRAMSTSVACERGMPIEDICRAATWAHDSVFASCYRLDTVSKGSSLTRKVLVSK